MIVFTVALIALEPLFLTWEKTTVFGVFVRRNFSAVADLGFALAYLSGFRRLLEYALTFGLAYGAVKLGDQLETRVGWLRWELPSEGILGIAAGFAVFYLISSFVGYWHHRLMHWRWFWQLHRFHHSATELNILTGFRENPGAAVVNVLLTLSPLFFLKVPDAGLFASFVLVNQIISSLQHSELQWSYGWVGRWIIASPQMHQIYHSVDEEHRDRNFAICPLWDRMFGTWYAGANRPSAYGILDPAHVERPFSQWLTDVWYFYRDVYRDVAQWLVNLVRGTKRGSPSQAAALDRPASIPAE